MEKVKLLKFETFNKNNRRYSKQDIEETLENTKYPIFGQVSYPENGEYIQDKAFFCTNNIYIEDDFLYADIEMFENYENFILPEVMKNCVYRTNMVGKIDEDLYVKTDKILGISLINKEDDSFKDLM